MQARSRIANAGFLNRIDFSKFRRVLDIGSGNGENLLAIAKRYTSVQGTLFDFPSVAEMAARQFAEQGMDALDEGGLKTVKPFVEKYGINYTVLLGNQDVFNRFQGFGIPYTLVLDREQQIVGIYRGPVSREALEQDVKKIQQGI